MQFEFDDVALLVGKTPLTGTRIEGLAEIDTDGTIIDIWLTHDSLIVGSKIIHRRVHLDQGPFFDMCKSAIAARYASTITDLLNDYHSPAERRARKADRDYDNRY